MSSDSVSHLQLVVDRILSRGARESAPSLLKGTGVVPDGDSVNLQHEVEKLGHLGSLLESEYKSGVRYGLEDLEDFQKSLAHLYWHAQQQIDAHGKDENRESVRLTDVVEKLYNIKDWVQKMEDLMRDELSSPVLSDSDETKKDETPSTSSVQD
ncbi:hypothetical protein MPTK1_4g18500 [Marchantia polymorpha subsp. ruderalis]|nr:hypothetical protein MARPO_0041s0131 [Marchantia polymorpha]BBN09286.1 hypothetical protein Mp_4g18500 [Marchantia polymorpha subsp. ruderalis]|eukprot:PTQ40275.1 hypothetical protein MARPO_0041s0131 [Marchantia polymorpha]